jgi:zinc protease
MIGRAHVKGLLLAVLAAATLAPARGAAFAVPEPVVRTLPNGLRVAVLPDSSLPVVQAQLLVRVGSREDPAGKSGLANLLAVSLGLGTATRARADFDAELEQTGASLSSAASRDFTLIGVSALAREFTSALDLMADAVAHPALDEREVARQRAQVFQSRVDARFSPAAIVEEHLWSMALSPHPYARPVGGSPEGLGRITRDDLVAHHATYYRPGQCMLAIAGDMDVEAAFEAAAGAFAGWTGDSVARPAVPAAQPPDTVLVRVVDMPDVPRVQLRVGHAGPARDSPDYFPLLVVNQLLGAAGARNVPGVAEARSSFVALRDGGLFSIGAAVPPQQARAAVEGIRENLRALQARPPAPAELERAKRVLVQTLPLTFETRANWAGQWLVAQFYGLPADFFRSNRQRMGAVTAADVQRAARLDLHPDRLMIVAAGPGVAVGKALEGLGPLEVVEVRAPAASAGHLAPEEGIELTPERLAEGRQRLTRAIAAHGGEKALKSMGDVEVTGRFMLVGPGGGMPAQIRQLRSDPYRMRTEMDFMGLGAVRVTQVLNDRRGWNQERDQVLVADSLRVRSMRMGFIGDPVHLLRLAADSTSRSVSAGSAEFLGQPADALWVATSDGEAWRLYLDPATGLVLGLSQEERSPAGQLTTVQRRFREYRTVNGVQWPFFEERYVNGSLVATTTAEQVRMGVAAPDSLFQAPKPGP